MIESSIKSLLPKNARDRGLLAALGGCFLISFDPSFIRMSGVAGFDTAFLFGLFTTISMSLIIQTTDSRGLVGTLRESGWPAVVSGLLIVGSALSFILSVKHTSVANTVVILSGRPVLTAVVSWILLGEKTTRNLWLAMAGVMSGIFIVMSGSLKSGHLAGDGFAVIAVLCLALNGTLWRRYKDVSRTAIVGLGGFFLALATFIPASPSNFSSDTWLIMAAMGLATAPIGRVLNATATRYIPAAEAAMITLGNVVLAPLWVFIFFQEQPPLTTLLGGGIALSTIITYIALTRRRLAQARA